MNFKKGMDVTESLIGVYGVSTTQGTVLRVDKKGAWIDNGVGNDPSGPFDINTGEYLGHSFPDIIRRIDINKNKEK